MDEITEGRFALLDDRLDHYGERIAALETAHADREADDKHAEGMRLNWIVVALFAFELLIGGWQLWWTVHHA
ncbi:hypothetical protein [Paraburkholderia bannensis]|uniref:hypothetical protein n=1 Tax=Paraburkholderia bannensis TaxID=765414 RepID=UPI000486B2D3|nr:hypothetical protein [Paraburkholderia bannensis]